MTMNRSDCRETSRVLGSCLNMVLRTLKKTSISIEFLLLMEKCFYYQ
ncbi:IS1-like element transposase [Photobacterium leiognathi]